MIFTNHGTFLKKRNFDNPCGPFEVSSVHVKCLWPITFLRCLQEQLQLYLPTGTTATSALAGQECVSQCVILVQFIVKFLYSWRLVGDFNHVILFWKDDPI